MKHILQEYKIATAYEYLTLSQKWFTEKWTFFNFLFFIFWRKKEKKNEFFFFYGKRKKEKINGLNLYT